MTTRRWVAVLIAAIGVTCRSSPTPMSDAHIAAVRGEVEAALRHAYDLTQPDVERRMLALYADSGRVVSASAGRVTTSRDTLEAGIRYFWRSVGANMREPTWIWDSMHVDVLTPATAVVTAAYRIPHRTPRNEPHTIAGALTAVFAKRGGRWVIIQEHLSDVPQSTDPASPPRNPGPTNTPHDD